MIYWASKKCDEMGKNKARMLDLKAYLITFIICLFYTLVYVLLVSCNTKIRCFKQFCDLCDKSVFQNNYISDIRIDWFLPYLLT